MKTFVVCLVLLASAVSSAQAQTATPIEGSADAKAIRKEIALVDRQIEREYAAAIKERNVALGRDRNMTPEQFEARWGSSRPQKIPKNVGDFSPHLKELSQQRAALEAKLAANIAH